MTFKRPWANGTAGVTFTLLEFVERLAALVPPPRSHLVHYHGVLAGRFEVYERGGNNHNTTAGIFTAPDDGVYAFS